MGSTAGQWDHPGTGNQTDLDLGSAAYQLCGLHVPCLGFPIPFQLNGGDDCNCLTGFLRENETVCMRGLLRGLAHHRQCLRSGNPVIS